MAASSYRSSLIWQHLESDEQHNGVLEEGRMLVLLVFLELQDNFIYDGLNPIFLAVHIISAPCPAIKDKSGVNDSIALEDILILGLSVKLNPEIECVDKTNNDKCSVAVDILILSCFR